jgi:hypothetical protein
MTPFDFVLIGLLIAGSIAGFYWQEGHGIFCLWKSMETRKKQIQLRRSKKISLQESQALDVVLETSSLCRQKQFTNEVDIRFFQDTSRLISQIASIYYPGEKEPEEKARIGNILSAFQEMNGEILAMLETPELKMLTQFRLKEMVSDFNANKKQSGFVSSFIMHRVRLIVIQGLWTQWVLLVGEAAIKVYEEHQADENFEPEALVDEMEQLKNEMDLSLPDEVRTIVEASRKKILFSLKPLPPAEVKSLYILLTENVARVWHPESSAPLYEVRIYDLLKSLAEYLEWAGQLKQKPVLNKMLGLRLSFLKEARDMANPFGKYKLNEWIEKYQVGRAAKWSKTIFKTLQKKQPSILFRDVAIGIVKEGGKRWLILILHDKIAEESNKLYKLAYTGS